MVSNSFRRTALVYGAVAGPATVAVLVAVAVTVDFPLLLLSMLTLGIPLFVVPAIVGITDTGIETASSNAFMGRDAGDPTDYQPDHTLPIPGKLAFVCWLSGVGVAGAVLMAAVA
ncbi:MAG: hypothetical protein ABEH83_10175 [Halobacterium sp.]